MKSWFILLLLLSSPLLASGQEASSGSAPGINTPAKDTDEQDFHDPFAKPDKETQERPPVADPFEKVNRAFFRFNDRMYFWVLKPTARGYNKVAPEPFRVSVRRFFVNARYPVRVVNNLLQAKFKAVGIETARFLVNSTWGIGGLFDPAREEFKLDPRPQDLDLTLGVYGLHPGPYFDWPLFGPSSVRGTVGMVGDGFLSPWNYLDGAAVFYGTRVFDTVNATSLQLGEYEKLKEASFDPYVALRDAYTENRRSLIQR